MRLASGWRVAALAALLAATPAMGEVTETIIVDNQYYTIGWASGRTDSDPEFAGKDVRGTSWYGNGVLSRKLAIESAQGPLAGTSSGGWFVDFISGAGNPTTGYATTGAAGTVADSDFATNATVTFAYELAAPTPVPEIDGAALAQGTLAIAALGLWAGARRREVARGVVGG
ncbi:hypothetical protein V6X63_03360 [Spiribacter sp. 221]|uniref:hypothetical protein n=1 Tax=Spiribacter onubensis TaxID=3122420 RepID=UPI00349F46BD